MIRSVGIAAACVLAGTITLLAQDAGRGARQGGPPPNPELQAAREALQRDVAEGKRLQDQLKIDRQSGNRDAAQRDQDALKANREQVKQDQDRIKQINSGRGREGRGAREGRGGREGRTGGEGRGRTGGGGRGRGAV